MTPSSYIALSSYQPRFSLSIDSPLNLSLCLQSKLEVLPTLAQPRCSMCRYLVVSNGIVHTMLYPI